jgi:hypothetical protein
LLVVGANDFAVLFAEILHQRGCPVILVDTNRERCEKARRRNLHVVQADALDVDALGDLDLSGIGGLVGLTANTQVNARACARTATSLGLSLRYAPASLMPDETERWLLLKAEARPVFAHCVNMIPLINRVSEGSAKAKTVKVGADGRIPDEAAVLPLVVVDRGNVRPFAAGEVLKANTEVVVLEFSTDDGLPFTLTQNGFKTGASLVQPGSS